MDSCGAAINIMFIINLILCKRNLEMTPLCQIERAPSDIYQGSDGGMVLPTDGRTLL